jgi:hypothetical protein
MRWRKLLIVLAVIAAVIAIILALIPREPKYEGRTLSEWIKDSAPRKSPDPETSRAIEAVRHIGTNGLPWLLKWIGAKEPSGWQVKLTTASHLPDWVRSQLLPSLLGFNSYYGHRRAALDGFLILGPDAAPAVPELFQIIAASPNGSPAYGALESISIAGIPGALNVVTNPANSVLCRFLAFNWICRTDPKFDSRQMVESSIVPLMVKCLREKNPDFSPLAAEGLAARHIEPGLVVPFYINRLTNWDPNIRYSAARGLSQYGASATSAVPALLIALKDLDPLLRYLAEDALFEIDQAALEKADPSLAGLKRHWRRTADPPAQRSDK